MKTIIQTSLDVLKSLEVANASGISPSASWSNYHVFLVPYKEQFDNKLNIGRMPFVNIASVQTDYEVVSQPDSGNMRKAIISVDVFLKNSVNSTEEQFWKLSRLINVICKKFSQNNFLSVIEIVVQEPVSNPVCLMSRIIFTLESMNDSQFSEGD